MNTQKKIVTWATAKKKIVAFRREGYKVAFTNGCFDILHVGHIQYLEAAKKKERILIVGLNSDRSVRAIKGKTRPINKQQDRAIVLASLACVDCVVIFDEETPYNVIKALKPDVLIKGADWEGKTVIGSDSVKASGGKVELIRYVKGKSTTDIIKKVEKRCRG